MAFVVVLKGAFKQRLAAVFIQEYLNTKYLIKKPVDLISSRTNKTILKQVNFNLRLNMTNYKIGALMRLYLYSVPQYLHLTKLVFGLATVCTKLNYEVETKQCMIISVYVCHIAA